MSSWADWLLVVIAFVVLSAVAYLLLTFAAHGPFSRPRKPGSEMVRVTCGKCGYDVVAPAKDAASEQHRHDGIDWRRFERPDRPARDRRG